MITVLVSGGFDPLHDGHIDYLEEARLRGEVVVALNSDAWLRKKKGYALMSWKTRRRILESVIFVDRVIAVNDADGTICEALQKIKPDYFANGGDRAEANPKEHAVCLELSVTELFNVGGPKIRSSSELVRAAR